MQSHLRKYGRARPNPGPACQHVPLLWREPRATPRARAALFLSSHEKERKKEKGAKKGEKRLMKRKEKTDAMRCECDPCDDREHEGQLDRCEWDPCDEH